MPFEKDSLEARLEALAGEVREIRERLQLLEGGAVRAAGVPKRPAREPEAVPVSATAPGEAVGSWSGSSLLARVSTVSFLLVIALGLRTVADSGAISPGAGVIAGLVYAAALMLAGWVQYARRSELAPVFGICGALLLFAIVIETHARFGSLPSGPAHLILGAAALYMVLLGERFGTPVPGVIGVLGALLAAVAMNVVHAEFPELMPLAVAVCILGVPVSRRLRGDWVGWVTFALPALLLSVWAARIRYSLGGACPDPSAVSLKASWFPPLVWLFAFTWLAQSLDGIMRPPRQRPSLLALFLPALGPAAAYLAGLQVASARGDARAHGVVGFLLAALLLALGAWVGRRRGGGPEALAAYGVAAVVLFSLGFSSATGSLLGALPLLSLTAMAFAVLAVRWQSGGTRVISYALQVFVAVALGFILVVGGAGEKNPLLAALASLVLAATAFAHHRWCRRHAPPEGSLAFSLLGRGDRCAVALLTAALAGGFFLLRTGVAVALGGRTQELHGAFLSAQSLIINLSGIVLFALAARGRSRELRTVAVLLTLVGAAKVFLYDLIVVQGLARVLSVFSFGLLAAVASVVLGRWQRREPS